MLRSFFMGMGSFGEIMAFNEKADFLWESKYLGFSCQFV